MSRHFPALLGALLLAACAAPASAPAAAPLRVLVYNVHAGKDAARADNLARVAGVVRDTRADLVLLQEVDRGTERSGRVDQVAELSRLTGMHGVFGRTLDFQGGGYGVALLSRWPVAEDTLLPLPGDPPEPRGVLRARIAAPDGPLYLLNTHLDASPEDTHRRQEAAALLEAAGRLRDGGARVLLGGDFNATPESAVVGMVREGGVARRVGGVRRRRRGLHLPREGARQADRLPVPPPARRLPLRAGGGRRGFGPPRRSLRPRSRIMVNRLSRPRGPGSRRAWMPTVLAALCALSGELGAQEPSPVPPGERVRVTAPGYERQLGTVVVVRGDTLVFRARGSDGDVPLAIPRVQRLEVPRGTLGPVRGGLIGGTLGFAGGLAAGLAVVGDEECTVSDCLTTRDLVAMVLPIAGTIAGGLGGAVVASRTERWVTLPLASLGPSGAVTLPAQLHAGALVRVHAPAATRRPVVGQVVGVRGDSLVVREPRSRAETAVPLGAVQSLEIGAGRTRTGSTLRGAGIGAVAGAVAIGALAYRNAQSDTFLVEHGEVGRTALWAAGFGGAPIGATLGGLAGYAVGTQRWVLLPPLARVTVGSGRGGGLALGVALPAR